MKRSALQWKTDVLGTVSYSPRHYYDHLATPPPSPLPPGNVEKILANIDTHFDGVTSVQPTHFNIV